MKSGDGKADDAPRCADALSDSRAMPHHDAANEATPGASAPLAEVSDLQTRHIVEVLNHTGARRALSPIGDAVSHALDMEIPDQPATVCVIVCDNDAIAEANRRFRGVDEATDVLSFPAPDNPAHLLGDVMVSWVYASAQAKFRHVKPVEEAAMLAVHGALHLLGYDDVEEEDRTAMLARMNMVMEAAGLPTEPAWSSLPHDGAAEGPGGG